MYVKPFHQLCRVTLLLCTISLVSCFEEEVSISVRHPTPGPVALQGVRSAAVALVDGRTGKTVVTALHRELQRNTTLALAEPEDVARALRRFSGTMQNRDWARLARDLQVDAIFFGMVDREAVDETFESFADRASGTTRYQRYADTTLQARVWAVDRFGRTLGEVSVDASQNKQPAGSATAVGIHNRSAAVFEMLFPQVDPQVYMAPAAERLASQFLDAMRPSDKDASVMLYTESSQWNAQHALSLAKAHFWMEAADLYRKGIMYADEAGGCVSARIYYNLGVCLGQAGDTLQAQIALEQARARGRYCGYLEHKVDNAMRMVSEIAPALQQSEIVGWSQQGGL